MRALARFLVNRRNAAGIVGISLLLFGTTAYISKDLEHEDDLLAFLPADNPDIGRFREINQRFGGLDVGIIGVELGRPMVTDDLVRLDKMTEAMRSMGGLDHVLSLSNVDDFTPDPQGGIRTSKLVETIPSSDGELEQLKQTIRTRENIVGTLISDDGQSLAVYAFPTYGSDQRDIATRIRTLATESFPETTLHFTGAPFVSSYIYDTTQADMRRLTPWAVGAIVLVLLVAFRDIRSVLLGLFGAGAGITFTYAAMVLLGIPVNVVLSAMPVILFAVGSAYGIHVLARYSAYATEGSLEEAVERTLVHTGPVVVTAGLTTALGLASFVAMDLRPLREFGLLSALGVIVALTWSLVFVPAVVVLLRLKPAPVGVGSLGLWMARKGAAVVHNRPKVLAFMTFVCGLGVLSARNVDDRLDQAAFYDPGSAPDRADVFMREAFGGSSFVQIEVVGDLKDPNVLRSIQYLADRLGGIEGVHRVQQVGDVVAAIAEAMEGQPRLPDNAAKSGLLYGLLMGNPAVRQLLDPELGRALMHVRLSTADIDATENTLSAIEGVVANEAMRSWKLVSPEADSKAKELLHERVASRIVAILRGYTVVDAQTILPLLGQAPSNGAALAAEERLSRWLQTEECPAPLKPQQAAMLARALVELGPGVTEGDRAERIAGTLSLAPDDPIVGDLAWSTETAVADARRDAAVAAHAELILSKVDQSGLPNQDDPRRNRLRSLVGGALLDLGLGEVAVADSVGPPMVDFAVSGTPLLHRGLSTSTRENQMKSLVGALGLVALVLSVRFRSLATGLLALSPTLGALALIYGGMGALGIRLDIGTSMLASIVIGAGVDFAVHQLSAWYANDSESFAAAAARANARTGTAILTNALAVAAGFFVLTLGEARPLKNVGGLTAAGLLVAAACTLTLIPALAKRRRYDPRVDTVDPADPPELRASAAALNSAASTTTREE